MVGDWVAGSYIELSPSTIDWSGPAIISLSWMVVLPSGLKTGFLGPFSYQFNPANSVEMETESAAAALAVREGIAVKLPPLDPAANPQQVNPDGTVVALVQTAQQAAAGS